MSERPGVLRDMIFTAIDTETTGLIPVFGKLIEFGAVRFDADGKELETFEELIDPEDDIPPEAQRVHGITHEMVSGKPTIREVLPEFLRFIEKAPTVLLAHNAAFDVGFIGVELARLGLPYPEHPVYDTMLMARYLFPYCHDYKLETLAVEMRLADKEDHRALSDARLVKEVFLFLLRQSPSLKTTRDLSRAAPPLTFFDSQVFQVDPPPGFEGIATAIEEGCEMIVVYEGGTKGLEPRNIKPRGLMSRKGTNYLVAYCLADEKEKFFRLDRIREFRLKNAGQ
jgi:DNA polymerase III epsilon subunit